MDKSELSMLLVASGLADNARYAEAIAHLARLKRPVLTKLDRFIKASCS